MLPFLLILGLPSLASGAASTDGAGLEVYVYINGDNDLLYATDEGKIVHQADDVFALWNNIARNAGERTRVHIYYDPNDEISASARGTVIRRLTDGVISEDRNFGETDSADPRWFRQLLRAESVQPNSNKILVFWGHGDGWRPISSYDHSHPESRFSYLDLAGMIEDGEFSAILFDTCAMAYLEVLTAFEGKTHYLMASQFELPLEGIQFRSVQLKQDLAVLEFLMKIQADTADYQRIKGGIRSPLTIFDLSQLLDLRTYFDSAFEKWVWSISEMSRRESRQFANRVRPRLAGAVLSDSAAADLRAFAWNLSAEDKHFLATVKKLTSGRSGSLSFMLPWNTEADQGDLVRLELERSPAWAELPNWDFEKKRMAYEKKGE